MSFLQQIYPGDAWASFLIRVLTEITLVTVVALLFTRIAARRNPAIRHGVCVCALMCVVLAPLTTLVLEKAGWRTFQISLEQPKPPVAIVGSQPYATPLVEPMNTPSPFWTLDRARGVASGVILIWLVGTGWMLVRLAGGARKVRRLRETARQGSHERLDAALQSLIAEERFPNTPVRFSPRVHSPVVVGSVNPTIILPEKLLDRLDDRQLRCVLAHELAHVRQRDPLIGLIQRLVEAGYWPHPLVHLLNLDLVRAREEVCDNVALHSSTAPHYADTLLMVALGISRHPPIPQTIGLLTRPWRLEERVKGLLDPHRRLTTTMNTRYLALMGITLAAGTAMIAGTHLEAAPYPPNPTDTLDIYTHYNANTKAVTISNHLRKHAQTKPSRDQVAYVVKSASPAPTVVEYSAVDVVQPVSPAPAAPATPLRLRLQPVPARHADRVGRTQEVTVTMVDRGNAAQLAPVPATPPTASDVVAAPAPAAPAPAVAAPAAAIASTVTSIAAAPPAVVRVGRADDTQSRISVVTVNPAVQADTILIQGDKAPTASGLTRLSGKDTIAFVSQDDAKHSITLYGTLTPDPTRPGAWTDMKRQMVIKDKSRAAAALPYTNAQHNNRVELLSDQVDANIQLTPSLRKGELYSIVTKPVSDRVTTVYIDGDHVRVVGDNIKVVYVHPKSDKKHAPKKQR